MSQSENLNRNFLFQLRLTREIIFIVMLSGTTSHNWKNWLFFIIVQDKNHVQ